MQGPGMGLKACRINRIKINNIYITILLGLCNVLRASHASNALGGQEAPKWKSRRLGEGPRRLLKYI